MKDKHKNRETGDLGEDIAVLYLKRHGYSIIERNYWKKWGEIDIIAEKSRKIYFVEVKTVSCEGVPLFDNREVGPASSHSAKATRDGRNSSSSEVEYRPEENVHTQKVKRLKRVIETYIIEHRMQNKDWQFDVVTVYMDVKTRKARVNVLANIIL
ncbi:MAG: YraN family protein [Candidatus Paceibacterota bacterium]